MSRKKVSIKICEKCFLCHSIVLCQFCSKCTKCCPHSACRGQTAKFLADLAGPGCRSQSSSNPARGLHPPFPDPTKPHKNSHSRKLLCQSSQEQLPVRGIASAYRQKCCRTGSPSDLARVLQPTLFSPQTQQQMETYIGPQPSEPIPQSREIQDGNTGNHQNLPLTRGMGNVGGLQGCLFPHTDTETVPEIPQISGPGPNLPVQSSSLWSIHSTHGIHCNHKGSEANGHAQGYKNPPVPRRLVSKSQIPPGLSPTYSDTGKNMPGPRLVSEFGKIRAGTQTSLQLRRLPVRPQVHGKRVLVGTRKQAAHKLPRAQSGSPSLQRVPKSLCGQNSPSGNRQYYGSRLHKQRRRHEVRPTLCPPVENLNLVFPQTGDPKGPAYPGPPQCDSRQAIQTGSDHPNRMVPPTSSFSTTMHTMAPASDRPICHEVQPQVTSVCLSSTGHPGCSSGCTHSAMGRSGCIRLPTDRHIEQSGGEATGLPVQKTHSDCAGIAQHALVLGSSGHVQSGPSQSAQPAQSANAALQSDSSQKSDKSKSPCLAPRAAKIKEQGFSEAVAARIEAPQRKSTRSVYEAKWTLFTKWCYTNQVDFRSPPVKSVADFLMYLFEEKKLQPSTIDGYRSAIADKLGDTTLNISKDHNLTRLLESFHRDRPKGRRGIPSWNLSLVLHQLTKPLSNLLGKHL